MDAQESFDNLRQLAKAKCDQDVEFARQTLKERLAQIDQMQRALDCIAPTVVQQRRVRRNAAESKQMIVELIPDRPFTFDELMRTLEQIPGDVPKSITFLRKLIRKMIRTGELKEVANPDSRQIKKYALSHIDAKPAFPPLAKTIYDVLDDSNAPMRAVEIAVQMIENGQPIENVDPSAAVNEILRVLREHPDRFKEVDEGYWRLR